MAGAVPAPWPSSEQGLAGLEQEGFLFLPAGPAHPHVAAEGSLPGV